MKSIVEYDSSSDEEQDIFSLKRKASPIINERSKMPKLPSFFTTTSKPSPSSSTTIISSNQGRIRTIPHRENSWATYVYFQVDLADEDKKSLLKYCNGLEEIPKQHISLSRTVYLKKRQLNPFVESIQKQISDTKSFSLSFAQIAQLTNDEKTRSFVTLEIGTGYNELLECQKRVDEVMIQHNQPVFYDPPRFHTSIAWSLDEKEIELLQIPQSCIDNMIINKFHISRLFIKQGHLISHIDLE